MDVVVERVVKMCVEGEKERRIAWTILMDEDPKKNTVPSLGYLAIKSLIDKLLDGGDIESNLILSLINKEPVSLYQFKVQHMFSSVQYSEQYLKDRATMAKLRADPYFMFAVMQQDQQFREFMEIIVTKKTLIIRKTFFAEVAEIPHRENIDYDTYWATRFAQLSFALKYTSISVKVRGEEGDNLRDHFNRAAVIARSINRVIPEEGWQVAIERNEREGGAKRPVYATMSGKSELYTAVIHFYSVVIYSSRDVKKYFGYYA